MKLRGEEEMVVELWVVWCWDRVRESRRVVQMFQVLPKVEFRGHVPDRLSYTQSGYCLGAAALSQIYFLAKLCSLFSSSFFPQPQTCAQFSLQRLFADPL